MTTNIGIYRVGLSHQDVPPLLCYVCILRQIAQTFSLTRMRFKKISINAQDTQLRKTWWISYTFIL